MDLFLFEKIAVARLKQRCVDDGSASLRFRMDDGLGDVRLTRQEWEALGGWFRGEVAPSARKLRLAVLLTLPAIIALFGIAANFPPMMAVLESVERVSPALLMFLLCAGLPLTFMILHMLAVQRAVDGVRAALVSRPRLGASPPSRAVNTLELIALVLVGPHLIVGLWGSLFPNAFRNTPWTGAHLDGFGVAGIALFLLLGFLRWRRTRPIPDAGEAGRSVDVVARARETSP